MCGFDNQVNRESVFNAMLAERVSVLQDLTGKNQNQLVLLRLKSFRDFLFKLLRGQNMRVMMLHVKSDQYNLTFVQHHSPFY